MEQRDIESGLKHDHNIYPILPVEEKALIKTNEINALSNQTKKIKDYIQWSVFNTFCCCLCLGIAAFVFSIKTRNSQLNQESNSESERFSKVAFKLNLTATIMGFIILVIIISLIVLFYYMIKDIKFCWIFVNKLFITK